MDRGVLYRLTGPTEWARAPAQYSYSTLRSLRECTLRWQLQRSSYGEQQGFPERPSMAAVMGKIIHHALELLFKALGARGLPAIGSTPFQQVLRELDLVVRIRELVQRQQALLSAQPRSAGLRVGMSERDLYNQVCRLFHPLYAQTRTARQERTIAPEKTFHQPEELLHRLQAKGVLTEVRLSHPTLPLVGIIDLLWRDRGETRIVDFKTGVLQPHHREQLVLYALLWWRVTGDLPSHLELRYLEGTETFSVAEEDLAALEEQLAAELPGLSVAFERPPAQRARLGSHCRHCDVRGMCDAYWKQRPVDVAVAGEGVWRDAEVTVVAILSEADVLCQDNAGTELVLSFREELGPTLTSPQTGEQLRILSAFQPTGQMELQIRSGTEVFRRPPNISQ